MKYMDFICMNEDGVTLYDDDGTLRVFDKDNSEKKDIVYGEVCDLLADNVERGEKFTEVELRCLI